jgi:non-specific serine/threonine protein kinase
MASGEHTVRPEAPGAFAFADVEIDARAHRLLRGGCEIPVEPKAFSVLLEFLAHPGQLLSRDQLLDAVWGHSFVTPATLNRIIAQLRKALADDSEAPRCIQTVHGLGYRFIAALEHVPEKAGGPALRFAPPARARLPERTDPLIGRDRDIEALKLMLRDCRLVTITGPGGLGKTQAALETARSVAADFPDGVWLFDCTPQTEGDALVRWLAGMFDVHATTDAAQLIARLGELLQARRALLVFDNCERIAEPLGKAAASLLSCCVDLHILVTSQRRLNCAGESLYGLPPLQVPPQAEWATDEQIASLSSISAVRLLLLRSQACASGFTLTRANTATVAEICRRVAGLPLALELAAARLRLLSPEQLLLRMEDHLLSLSEDNPNRPARHQTLGALIEWSFVLLSEHEQSLLCGLSVFVGTCTLDGASAVGAVFELGEEQTLDLLGGLVDKSLLTVDATTNPPSYRLLDSVRLFAQERLAASGNEARVRTAHLAHFVKLTERVNAEILSCRQQLWVERILREQANLRAAFVYALADTGLVEHALAIVANLCWYFRARSDYVQSAELLDSALRVTSRNAPHRALALIALGTVSHQSQMHERAASCLREGVALATDRDDNWLAAAGQAILAFELANCGDFHGAIDATESALGVAVSLNDRWLRSQALLSRGIVYGLQGRYREGEVWLSEAAEWVASPPNDAFQHFYALINCALLRYYLGKAPQAARGWLDVLDGCVKLQNLRGASGCIEGAAYLAIEHGDPGKSVRFLASAARVRELTGAPLMPLWRKGQQATERRACNMLGAAFEPAQREGAAARFEDIIGEARMLLGEIAAQPERAGASDPSGS